MSELWIWGWMITRSLEDSQFCWGMISKIAIMQHILCILECLGLQKKVAQVQFGRSHVVFSFNDAYSVFEGWLGVHQGSRVGGIFYVVFVESVGCASWSWDSHYGSLQGLRTYSLRAESEHLLVEPESRPLKWYQALNLEGEKRL